MKDLAIVLGVGRVNIKPSPPQTIFGRSWEMAFTMCSLGQSGDYSGTVSNIERDRIHFGPVPGVEQKIKITEELKTYKNIPYIDYPLS